jgi:CBS domain-containing protein
MRVHEIMSSSVELVGPDTPIRDAACVMRDNDIGALPVGENDRLIGMVTDRDIAVRAVAEGLGATAKVRDVMSEGIDYCFEDDDVDDAAAKMSQAQVRRLAVLNRDKRLVGVLSLGDIAQGGDADVAGVALEGVTYRTEKL